MIRLHCLTVLLLSTIASSTAWQRVLISDKGTSFDTQVSHSLAYFTKNPFLRDNDADFCAPCYPETQSLLRKQHKFKTQLIKVGELGGFVIYDLFYFFDGHVNTGQIDWKSILVSDAPNQFHEIYHLQPPSALIKPSFVIKAGTREILGTRDRVPGTGNQYDEDYWWFGASGPLLINTDSINDTLHSLLPNGYGVIKGGGLDMSDLTFHQEVWKRDDANCCPSGGTVTLRFRLDHGRLIVVEKQYNPSVTPPA